MSLDSCIRDFIRPGSIVFDVGANTGYIAKRIVELTGRRGRCYAFECHPQIFSELSQRAAAIPTLNIKPYCLAVGGKVGSSDFYFGDATHATEASTTVASLAKIEHLGNITRCQVEMVTLDYFCATYKLKPELIKIDVEGAEADVVQGAVHYLTQHRPYLVFEFGHELEPKLGTVPKHFHLLRELGYELFVIDLFRANPTADPAHELFNTRSEAFFRFEDSELLKIAPLVGNIFAKPKEKKKPIEILPLSSVWAGGIENRPKFDPWRGVPTYKRKLIKGTRKILETFGIGY